MITKDWKVSTKWAWAWWYRYLHKVENAIEKIEGYSFIRKYFYRDALQLLKEQKTFIERSIKREKELVMLKDLSRLHSSEVDNIVKKNKSLEKEINKWKTLWYISKKDELKWEKKEEIVWIPFEEACSEDKPREVIQPKLIKPKELRGNITFIQVAKPKRGRPKWKPRTWQNVWRKKQSVLAKDLM